MTAPRDDGVVLAIDTGTSRVVVGLARPDGTPMGASMWVAGHRHGETLLPAIDALLEETAVMRHQLVGVVVGTGPGSFTGLRVGIATAKGIAHGLGIPIVGISTATALLDAAEGGSTDLALLLPAGPQDRVLVHGGVVMRAPAGLDLEVAPTTTLIAVDLAGRAPDDATRRGDGAIEGLGVALLRRGAARLAAGDTDDLAELVPEYVTLPRGVLRQTGEVEWSRDPR